MTADVYQGVSRVIIDFETRSRLNVRDVGAWRYSEEPSTDLLCMAYRLRVPGQPDHPTTLWYPADAAFANLMGEMPDFPAEVVDWVLADHVFEAHNVQFEFAVWTNVLHQRYGIPVPRRWVDTMASCAYRALPLALDDAGAALGLEIQKDKRGSYLLQKLSKPRRPTKKDKSEWCEDPDLMRELGEYNVTDVDSEACLSDAVGDLPRGEYAVWRLDQRMNARGVALDLDYVGAALDVVNLIETRLNAELRTITGGQIETGNQVAAIREWLDAHGLFLPSLDKHVVAEVLGNRHADLSAPVRRILEIRQQLARGSAKKLKRALECVCRDGKVRGLLQYHGASTGRFAGRLLQPQNYPRGNSSLHNRWSDDGSKSWLDMDTLVDHIKIGGEPAVAILEMLYGDPMDAITTSLRGMFVASPGCILRVADFSAIEARGTFWLAGQVDAVDAFHAYDRGEGPDIYCVMAQKLYRKPVDKKTDGGRARQLGKITILGCGYQMWWPKLQFQAAQDYGVELDDGTAEWLVKTYRDEMIAVPILWRGLEEAATMALENPGKVAQYRSVSYQVIEDEAGVWLTCVLPNGRRLWYYDPRMVDDRDPNSGRLRRNVSYMGKDSKRQGQWGRIRTYGGMLTENVVQAISRDLMVEGMFRVEAAGYPLVLSIHDELVGDCPEGHGTQQEFESLMAGPNQPWADGLPVAVEGWAGYRYKKG